MPASSSNHSTRRYDFLKHQLVKPLVHNHYRIRGGEDSVFETECDLLRSAGHDVLIWEKHNNDVREDRGPFGKLSLFLGTIWNRNAYREMRAHLLADRPDVVHVHNFFPQFSPSIFWACAREKIPVVLTLHNYRLACLNGYLYRDGTGICEKCLGKCPWAGVERRCYRNSLSASLAVAAMLMVHRALGTWRHKVTRYIALTEFARGKFIEAGLPAEKIVVKPNAVKVPEGLVPMQKKPGHSPRVVYIGRLSSEKGVDVLVRAWTKLHDVTSGAELWIVGDGPERTRLEALANNSAETHFPIRFVGAKSHDEALALLRTSDLLVLPSVCYETFGLAVMEAAALARLSTFGLSKTTKRRGTAAFCRQVCTTSTPVARGPTWRKSVAEVVLEASNQVVPATGTRRDPVRHVESGRVRGRHSSGYGRRSCRCS